MLLYQVALSLSFKLLATYKKDAGWLPKPQCNFVIAVLPPLLMDKGQATQGARHAAWWELCPLVIGGSETDGTVRAKLLSLS